MTTTPGMTTRELKRHFAKAIDYLDRNYAYFLTNVISVGKPQWTEAIPTAAVMMEETVDASNKDSDDFRFMFNPTFAESLDVPGMAFILAHETMHIILNHLKLLSSYVDKDAYAKLVDRASKGDRLSRDEIKQMMEFKQIASKFNIAADCVINDYLGQAGMEVWPDACRGEHFIGEDAAFLTVGDVFDRLVLPESEDSDGRGSGALDSHDWMFDPDFADKMADAIDKFNGQVEGNSTLPNDLKEKRNEEEGKLTDAQQQIQDSMRAGSEAGNIRAFQEQTGLQMSWVKLLKEVDPDMFKEPGLAPPPRPAWHKRPRKLAAFPDVNLPVFRKDEKDEKMSREKPAIVMALDYSGSIGPNDADRFATLARSIPTERIKLFCCTFTTTYKVFDLDNPHGGGSGGTSFDPIVSFIENDVKPELNGSYPKAVIVITDGEAALSPRYMPTESEQNSWVWLISPRDRSSVYYSASRDIGRRAMLSEYVL